MTTTNLAWTDARLTALFERYRLRYWPHSRRLRRYRITAATLAGAVVGQCDYLMRTLTIDLQGHKSDRDIRGTVLHEMAHAVVGTGGHGAPFWTQLEYLLARKAPITVGFPELGEQAGHLSAIPTRFRRCRRLFRPVYTRWQREFDRKFASLASTTLSPDMFGAEFEDVASLEDVTWRPLWTVKAREFGLMDMDGRVPPSARAYERAARRGYRKGRRSFLEAQRNRAAFEARFAHERAADVSRRPIEVDQ